MSVALLVGGRHQGKTTTCRQLADGLRRRGLGLAGVVTPAVWIANRCVGYLAVDLAGQQVARLATLEGPGAERIGQYHFLSEGLELGRDALRRAAESDFDLAIVDEVGPLELAGGGWSQVLDRLVARPGLTLLTVRRSLAAAVAQRWGAAQTPDYDLADGPDRVIAAVCARLGATGGAAV